MFNHHILSNQSGYEPFDRWMSVNTGINFDGHKNLYSYRGSTVDRTSPRIVNIVENQVLVKYNAQRLLQYFGFISEP